MVRNKLSENVSHAQHLLSRNVYEGIFLGNLDVQGRKKLITVKPMNREVTNSSEVLEDLEVTQEFEKIKKK